ncbi:hypothetical protein CJ030_MR1G027487 [Morella rubra]|uniref:PGG domain-containing protein n=1 Tax=Morella rubra TaxID=262757 RepID=A0A6A1WV86_9ROSI|nr:hypothetical protein CJ030_MR1G027487 [Morella rubra]
MKGKVDMANSDSEEYQKRLENAATAHLVAATLITTVTFAAGITIPGGFVGNDGTHPGSAILRSSAAFVAFVIFNTTSLVFSSSAVLIHLLVPLLPKPESRANFSMVAWLFILVAMVTMVGAFVTGSYAVLAHSAGLAIASCVIGLSFIPILFLIVVKFYSYF